MGFGTMSRKNLERQRYRICNNSTLSPYSFSNPTILFPITMSQNKDQQKGDAERFADKLKDEANKLHDEADRFGEKFKDEAEKFSGEARQHADKAFDEIKVASNEVVDKVRELIEEGNARHISIRKGKKTLIDIPLTVGVGAGAAAVLIAPVLSAVGALVAVLSDVTLVVEREVQDVVEEKAEDVADAAKEGAENVEEAVKDAADEAKEGAEKTVGRG